MDRQVLQADVITKNCPRSNDKKEDYGENLQMSL